MQYYLPTALIIIQLSAAVVYLAQHDWRHAAYWVAASVLTTVVTF